jgi:hypothetical protein
MTRTPDVADGTTITTTWGNEIRNRTIQVFATTAERDAWIAPNGAMCVVTANYYVYQRTGNGWRLLVNPTPLVPYETGYGNFQTAGDGLCVIAHTLGVVPSTIIATPSNPPSSFASVQLVARTTTSFSLICRSTSGPISALCSINWVVFR